MASARPAIISSTACSGVACADQDALEGGEHGALGPAGGTREARLRNAEAERVGGRLVHRIARDALVLRGRRRGREVAGLFEEGDGGIRLAPELDPLPGRVGVLGLGDRVVGVGEAGDARCRAGRDRHGAELHAGLELGRDVLVRAGVVVDHRRLAGLEALDDLAEAIVGRARRRRVSLAMSAQ